VNATAPAAPFVHAVRLRPAAARDDYSATLPALRGVERIELDPRVTFLVGENGSGKSTLVEAIAVKAKLNVEGGGKLLRFATRSSHSTLHSRLELERSERPPVNSFFLRAESVFNLATAIETGGPIGARENVYDRPLHEQSHGESFLDIAVNRLGPRGFYLFDEPEAALSVNGQLALMRRIHELVEQAPRDLGDVLDRALEGLLVRLRRLAVAADLAHVLERRRARLFTARRRLDVVERVDGSAHAESLARGWGTSERLQAA
jgi:predicted ATPase